MTDKKTEVLKLALEGAANYIDSLGGDSRKYRQALAEQPAIKRDLTPEQPEQQQELAEAYRAELDKLSQRNYELRFENAKLKTQQQEPVAWADECRISLVTAIHFLASDYENALGVFRDDTEARRKAEGDIAYARKIAAKWNWNGTSPPASKPWVGLTDFIKHEVENAYDWSEWVCPDPESYLMKCCDCGLVHEVQFRVAKYKPAPSDECEVVSDPDLQAQFRMRRSEQWLPADTAHRAGGLPMAEQPTQQWNAGVPSLYPEPEPGMSIKATYEQPASKPWVGLTDEDKREIVNNNSSPLGGMLDAEAKLKEKNA